MKTNNIKFNEAELNEHMDVIATYMDDEIREKLHFEIAPCSASEFLTRYCEEDDGFLELLENEFGYIFE